MAAVPGIPFVQLGTIGPLPWFYVIVAIGIVIGARVLRRYAEWHGATDPHIRGLLIWVMLGSFVGGHGFDVIAYQWDQPGEPSGWWPPGRWPLPLRFWDGLSSYGGFLGGELGFGLYVWRRRLPPALFADITVLGGLVAFSIGRVACALVSDHVGAVVDPSRWYAIFAMNYPRSAGLVHLAAQDAGTGEVVRAWNLGLVELLYLIPVNVVILWIAFRRSRPKAGLLTAMVGLLYAPARFFLDFLRPAATDPRTLGLTFAQWGSILVFAVVTYVAVRIVRGGTPAQPLTPVPVTRR